MAIILLFLWLVSGVIPFYLADKNEEDLFWGYLLAGGCGPFVWLVLLYRYIKCGYFLKR